MSKSFQAATLFECTSWTFTANQKTGKHNFILSVFWFAVVRQWSYTNLRLNLFKLFANNRFENSEAFVKTLRKELLVDLPKVRKIRRIIYRALDRISGRG